MRVRCTIDDDFLRKWYWVKPNTVWKVLKVVNCRTKYAGKIKKEWKEYWIEVRMHYQEINSYMQLTSIRLRDDECEVVQYKSNSKYFEADGCSA